MNFFHAIHRLILISLFTGFGIQTLYAYTIILDEFKGTPEHCESFKSLVRGFLVQSPRFEVVERQHLRRAVMESELAQADFAETDSLKLNVKIAELAISVNIYPQDKGIFQLDFTVTNLKNLKADFSRTISYEGPSNLENVASYMVNEMKKIYPSSSEIKTRQADSIYTSASALWEAKGFTAYEWDAYYQNRKPFDSWSQTQIYDPRKAAMLAAIPCYSGLFYTKDWGRAFFWALAEGVVLLNGAAQKSNLKKSIYLSAIIPVSFVDIYLSKRSARRKAEASRTLKSYYKSHPYPFSFMGSRGQ